MDDAITKPMARSMADWNVMPSGEPVYVLKAEWDRVYDSFPAARYSAEHTDPTEIDFLALNREFS